MDPQSQRQHAAEADDWLHRGRALLLEGLLRRCLVAGAAGGVRTADGRADGEDAPRLLEVGPGAGGNLEVMRRFGALDVVETSDEFVEQLRERPEVSTIHHGGLPELEVSTSYDAIVAFDVLEHIERDDLALGWIADHLRPGGVFVASVPAYQWLFSDHDRAIHHYRRYTRRSLERLIAARLRIAWSSYFNTTLFPLAVASRGVWQAKRRLSGQSGQPGKQSSTTPEPVDRLFFRVVQAEARRLAAGARAPFGLSVVCVAWRPPH